jgi:hypothetical protein
MSPHAVNTFVSDLVHMAQAMERLPQVEKELIEALDQVAIKEQYIQRLQGERIDHANSIEELRRQVKSVEGQRDDAELRFLLADDRAQHAIKALRDVAGSLGVTISVIDPRPEAQAVEPVNPKMGWDQWAEGQSADPLPIQHTVVLDVTPDGEVHSPTSDTVGPTASIPGSFVHVSPPVSSDNATAADVSMTSGQSEVDPTISVTLQPNTLVMSGGTTQGVGGTGTTADGLRVNEGSVQPHPTEASVGPVPLPSGVSSQGEGHGEGSVSGDPTATSIKTAQSAFVPSAEMQDTAPTMTSASDPEPMPRYTWAWYQWRDRTIEDRVKDGLPAVSQASHYS